MLVCNVSMQPARAAVDATIAEVTVAADEIVDALGIFVTLIDESGFADATSDGSAASFMFEAASASDAVDVAGSVFTGAIAEAASAADTVDTSIISARRSAMLIDVFVNSDTSREANANGIMVNI